MLKHFFRMWRGIVAGVASLLLVVACGVDDRCDLSKDLDLTISMGKDLAFPIGSTGKIMLSELIDTADVDVLEIDPVTGDYSIVKSGSFSPAKFSVGTLDFYVASASESQHFDIELQDLSAFENLPSWVIDEMKKNKYPYVAHEDVEYTTTFDVSPEVPSEIKKLRRMTLADSVKLELELKIFSEGHQSDDLLELTRNIYFKSDEADGMVIQLPEYLVFTKNSNVNAGKLVIDGVAEYDAAKQALCYKKELFIEAVDFSHLPDGYLAVNDGIVDVHDELSASGHIVSDTIMLEFENLTHIHSVDIQCDIKMGRFVVDEIEAVFDPELELIKESVNLNLGSELDFLKNAYFDFSDPRIFLTLNNPVDATIYANAEFVALDENDQVMEGSALNVGLNFTGNTVNRFFINRHGSVVEGYTTVSVPELNNIVKRIPEKIEVALTATVEDKFSKLALGRDYEIAGDYAVSLPMLFDTLHVVYTETIDGLKDESDGSGNLFSDYLGEVKAVTLSFDLLNTVPISLTPDIKAYDMDGNILETLTLDFEGSIEKGNGVVDGVVTEPVVSHIVVKLSAAEIERLDRVDVNIIGAGSGVFNANEYVQLKNIVFSIDEPVSIDFDK